MRAGRIRASAPAHVRSAPWRPRPLGLLVLLLLAAAPIATAQGVATDALTIFLGSLQQSPQVRAAMEQVQAARFALDAAFDPVSLTASAAYNAFQNDVVDLDPTTPGDQGLPGSATTLNAALTFRPFLFGDVADGVDRRTIELEQARVDLAVRRAEVEVQALQAAYAVELAQRALATARQGAALADDARAATHTRYAKGAATARDVREADTGAVEAHASVATAEGTLALARLSLASLVGDVPAPNVAALELPQVNGVPASLQRARLAAALAELGVRNARRSVHPVAQASYTYNLDDHNKLGIALESRTLQPKLDYSYSDPGASFPQNATNGVFTIAVSAVVSPGVFQGLAATDATVRAAQAGVEAAERGATLQKAVLDNDLSQARRSLDIAERKLADAAAALAEVRRREALGLDVPLSTQRAALAHTSQALAVQRAQQDLFDKTLAFFPYYARPLSSLTDPGEATTTPEAHP